MLPTSTGDLKEKGYKKIIKNKKLDLHAQAMTFGSFGSFGKGTWNVINTVCNPDRHPHATGDFDPWNLPDPKRDFIVTLASKSAYTTNGARYCFSTALN